MKAHMLLCLTLFVLGCGDDRRHSPHPNQSAAGVPSTAYELGVVNDSPTNIYVDLKYGGLEEYVGVVGKGVGKHEGFVSFSIGWVVEISWSEGHNDAEKKTAKLPTEQYASSRNRIKSIELHYQTNGEWSVVAYDAVGLRQNKVEPDRIDQGISQLPPTPASTNAVSNVTTNK